MELNITETQMRAIVGQQIRRAVADTTRALSVRMPSDVDAAIASVELGVGMALDRVIQDLHNYDKEYGAQY